LITSILPSSHEPDPDYIGKLGDKLKMKLFESNLFTPGTKPNPDPFEVKQGAVGTCPLIAVLVATAHVPKTKEIIFNMIKEKKLSHDFAFLTVRTREAFEYRPHPQDFKEGDNDHSTMDFDYRTWVYLKNKNGDIIKDGEGRPIRKTKKSLFTYFILGPYSPQYNLSP
jgi:hypothetical protein